VDTTRRECTPVSRRECRATTRQECSDITRRECTPITRRECTPTTRRECSTENERVCRTETRNECRNVSRRECTPTTRRECKTENVCRNVEDRVCRKGPDGREVCTPITRRECKQEQVCRDVQDQVCRDVTEQVCGPVSHQVCENVPRQVCRDVPDQVCRDVQDQVCRDVSDRVCRNVPDTICEDVWDQVCRDIPDQVCRDVEDQVCRTVEDRVCSRVPVFEDVPYACTRTERVPVGTELVWSVRANVTFNLGAFPEGIKNVREIFTLKLKGEELTFEPKALSGQLLVFVNKSIQIAVTGEKEKTITASYGLSFVRLEDVLAPFSAEIQDFRLEGRLLKFTLATPKLADAMKVTIGIQSKATARPTQVHQGDVAREALSLTPQGARTLAVIDLDRVLRQPLARQTVHGITVTLGLADQARSALMNAQAIAGRDSKTAAKDLKTE
jgi:hypothetical protein